MLKYLSELSPSHIYLIVGLVLLIAEALGAGGFLLGMAIAALITGVLAMFVDSWQLQLFIFSVLSVIFTVVYIKRFKTFNEKRESGYELNDRFSQQINRAGKIVEVSGGQQGKMQIGDTFWNCQFSEELDVGDDVVVSSVSEEKLVVTKA